MALRYDDEISRHERVKKKTKMKKKYVRNVRTSQSSHGRWKRPQASAGEKTKRKKKERGRENSHFFYSDAVDVEMYGRTGEASSAAIQKGLIVFKYAK